MQYILLLLSLLLSPIVYGSNAAAPAPKFEIRSRPETDYGALVSARKFRTLDEPYREITFLGEFHVGFTKPTFDDQCKAIDAYMAFLKQSKTKPLFLLELPPLFSTKGNTPTHYAFERLTQNKDIATVDCFDQRSVGSALLSQFLKSLLVDEQDKETNSNSVKRYCTAMYEQFDAEMVKKIACTETELGDALSLIKSVGTEFRDTLALIKASPTFPREVLEILEADVRVLQKHKLLSITDKKSFINTLHKLAFSGRENVSACYACMHRNSALVGDYYLLQAILKGFITHRQIIVVGGAAHSRRIEKAMLPPTLFPCNGFDWISGDKDEDPPPLTSTQLQLALAIPAPLNNEQGTKESEVDVKSNAVAHNAAAAMAAPGTIQQITCHACRKPLEKQMECGKCKKVYYCNETCQKNDWPTHKALCGT